MSAAAFGGGAIRIIESALWMGQATRQAVPPPTARGVCMATCLQCKHFRNSSDYLEAACKGLTVLSSAYASVRSEDGICVLQDLYLSANQCCNRFVPVFSAVAPSHRDR